MTLTGLFIEKNDNIVCIDVSTPLKNTTPYFLHSPLLYLQTVQAPLFKQSPYILVFHEPLNLKIGFFSEPPFLRNHTSWFSFMIHMCKMIISPVIFFIF